MKGLSICNLSVSWLMEVPPGIPCIKRGGSSRHQTACVACHDDKAKCEWIINSNAGSKDASSMSGVGGIMVLGVTRLYKPVLALRTSQSLRVRNPTTGMFF